MSGPFADLRQRLSRSLWPAAWSNDAFQSDTVKAGTPLQPKPDRCSCCGVLASEQSGVVVEMTIYTPAPSWSLCWACLHRAALWAANQSRKEAPES